MQLQPVNYAEGLTEKDFELLYLKPGRPVIVRDFLAGSDAWNKWNYDYFIDKAGEQAISVHGVEDGRPDKVTSPPVKKMSLGRYLRLIKNEPTELRLFLFNLLREKPELRRDLHINLPVKKLLKGYPFMFFGGAGSSVRSHYDIDMSHVFLTQFEGVKKILLFPNDQSDLLYRLPHNFHGLADLKKPDYEKFPALRLASGWECILHPGETLFIPSGYWHYIRYVSQGYSVSHRALSSSFPDQLTGLRNILITRKFDNGMRKLFGKKWFDHKVRVAYRRADKFLKNAGSALNETTLRHTGSRHERLLDV